MDFTFTDWLWVKLIGGGILVFFISFFFRLFTGRSIGEALNERQARRDSQKRR